MNFLSKLFGGKTSATTNGNTSSSLSASNSMKIYVVLGSTKPISEDNVRTLVTMARDELAKTNKEFINRMNECQKLESPTIAMSINLTGSINSDTVALYDQCIKALIKDQPLHTFAMNINHFYIAARNPSLDLKWIAVFHFE